MHSNLDKLILELKQRLAPIQEQVNAEYGMPKWPVGLIIGPPRSGTTVFLQFLASTGHFSYPSNLLARFAYAPYIGALVQKMLLNSEFDPHGDFADIRSTPSFDSELGKSKGALATNEFFHFWRISLNRYFPEPFTEQELEKIDYDRLTAGLASIEAAFQKPFCTKEMLLQYNLSKFFKHQPYSFYFRLVRNPIYVCQSILQARIKYSGSKEEWWSAKPEEYEKLKVLDVYRQIAGQVYYTEKAIDAGLSEVPDENQLTISYERFCSDPESIYREIVDKYNSLGYELPCELNSAYRFRSTNEFRLPIEEIKKFKEAYAELCSLNE